MTELPNPGEEGYRTAHKTNKDESYANVVMVADIFPRIKQEDVPKGGDRCLKV